MGKFLFGIIVGILLIVVAVYFFLSKGGLPMDAGGAKSLPMERLLARAALAGSMGKAAQEQAPVAADETNLLAGARLYQTRGCAGCHGRIDDANSGSGKNFYPKAPHLLPPSKGVTDDEVGETHWVVKNGIRFSGMPTYGTRLNETELWQVSLLLHNADKLPASVQEALRENPRDGARRSPSPSPFLSPSPSSTPSPLSTESPSPQP
jgi:mono/diheme cytochrome c family protein